MDAYECYSALITKLTRENELKSKSQIFSNLKTNVEKVNFVNALLNESNLMPKITPKIEKNNEIASEFKQKGNEQFHPRIKNYLGALEWYNKGIAHSEYGSEILAMCYANRSAVYFEWKLYTLCLQNIKLAKESKYPERLMDKINKREQDCLKLIHKCQAHVYEPTCKDPKIKLSYESNPKIPFIVNCLELKESADFGRYIVTNEDLHAGDILVIEQHYSTYLLPAFHYKRCNYCHQERFRSLIPCESCTLVMFCSEECYKNAYEKYHKYECSVFGSLVSLYTKVMMLAMRTVMCAINTFRENLDEMKLYLDDIDEDKLNPFSFDWNTISPKEHYCTIHVLATNQNQRSEQNLYQRAVFTAIMRDVIFQHSPLQNIIKTEAHKDLITDLIFRHIQTAPVNMHSKMCMEYFPEMKMVDQMQLSSGSYPILSMLNHSCAPNIIRLNLQDGSICAVVNRPIKRGAQLFDNYGQHHCLEILQERQSQLHFQYMFKCHCEACENDYPLYHDLKSYSKNIVDKKDLQLLGDFNKNTAMQKLPLYCKFLDDNDRDYPSMELSSAQECMLRSLIIISNNMPLTKIFE